MKNFIALAAITAACSTSAFAQVSNFTGPSASVNLDFVGSSIKGRNIAGADKGAEFGLGKDDVGATVQAAYGFELSPTAVVNVGATYGLTGYKVMDDKDSIAHGSKVNTVKATNVMSVYVEPGFLVSNSTLGYAKVGYETAKLDSLSGTVKADLNISGIGYGFGMRSVLDKNLFIQVEVKRVVYDETNFKGDTESKFKPSATVGSIGIGYKF